MFQEEKGNDEFRNIKKLWLPFKAHGRENALGSY